MGKYIIKFYDYFNSLKLKQKILYLTAICVFISNGMLFLYTYSTHTKSTTEKAQDYNYSMIGQMIKNTDSYFKGIEQIALSLAYNKIVQDSTSYVSQKTDYERILEIRYIENALKLFVYSNKDIQIAIFMEHDENSFYTLYTEVNPYYKYKEDEWYKFISDSSEQKSIILNNPQNYYHQRDRKLVHSFVYKINSLYTQKVIGYILIDIDQERFRHFFQTDYIDIANTFIVSENNEIIYNYPQSSDMGNIDFSILDGQGWGYFDEMIDGEKCMVIFGTSEYTGWKIINIIPYKALLKDLNGTKNMFLLMLMFIFLIIIVVSYRFTGLITTPIEQLKYGMNKVKKGNFEFIVPSSSSDEIGDLINNFNNMSHEIHSLMKKNELEKLSKKEAELKALQHQINPHFLYNTLEMVMGLASERRMDEIIDICKNLGKMFRYNLGAQKMVLIRNELEQIKNYIFIMEKRFEKKFRVEYDIASDVLNYQTVKFTLQPFVENTLNHAFSGIVGGGVLLVRIKKQNDKIVFQIIDNGKGINPEKLDFINQELQSISENSMDSIDGSNDLGIMNVHLRFYLLFGNQYSINIRSELDKGTEVTIQIPMI